MDILSVLPAFLVVVLVMAASPGPAMALILQRAGLHGFRAAVPTVLGVELGLFLWALAAGLGLAALIAASETAFLVLKVVGAVFLVYLGVKAIRSGWALRDRSGVEPMPAPPKPHSDRGAFAEGLIVQLANPKAAAFTFAFYPQFIPHEGPVLATTLVLATIQVVIETALYLGLAAAVGSASVWFSRTRIRRRIDYISGSVLILLGLRVATASR
ncbi:LysE family translocator [Longivirga aurantiaca]|uniref:LysE family translocator n=1 Tax=Longivirga aurantiaca TaxID=1837743 RepID=A0ABW1SY59_9ACTN